MAPESRPGDSLSQPASCDAAAPPAATSPALARIVSLPGSEQREALATLVVAEIRAALLMADDEELPNDVSYFDLGLTSLRLVEVKERLETLLGRGINANVLFNSPTVKRLLDYLVEDLLACVITTPAAPGGAASGAHPVTAVPDGGDALALVDEALRELYQA